jgi:hypothetical protein
MKISENSGDPSLEFQILFTKKRKTCTITTPGFIGLYTFTWLPACM